MRWARLMDAQAEPPTRPALRMVKTRLGDVVSSEKWRYGPVFQRVCAGAANAKRVTGQETSPAAVPSRRTYGWQGDRAKSALLGEGPCNARARAGNRPAGTAGIHHP